MKTSLIIPFKNEEEYAQLTLEGIHSFLTEKQIDFEIIAVDDSSDGTWEIIQTFQKTHDRVQSAKGGNPSGYGMALKTGFEMASGDIIIPFNGDFCDSPEDVLAYIALISSGYDMVFGSRFVKGAIISGAPFSKTMLSRWGNGLIKLLFGLKCNDITNSFKAYRKEVWEEVQPTQQDTRLVIELALKSVLTGYSYTTMPLTWTGRKYGESKMAVFKVIPRYLSLIFNLRFRFRRSSR